MTFLKILVLVASLSYAAMVLFVFLTQRSMVFSPSRNMTSTPADIGLEFEDVWVRNKLGSRIHGWWIPGAEDAPTLFFCHGNAGNVTHRLESFRIFHSLGLNILIYDYSGYGVSEGSPSEKATQADSVAMWQWLMERGIDPASVVVFGRSLGGGVAAHVARYATDAGQKPCAVILESTFSSGVDLGKRLYPWLPVGLLSLHRYESVKHLAGLNIPALVVHSQDDDIVPYDLGVRLYESLGGPRSFLEIRGNHNSGYLDSGAAYVEGLRTFLDGLPCGKKVPGSVSGGD